MAARPPVSPLALAVDQFNHWRFYDCHETLEDIWREAGGKTPVGDAAFYHGLIKLAAGFHHLLRGNHHGALTLLTDGARLLERYRPAYLGIDVERLALALPSCLDALRALGPARIRDFDRSLIPRITEQGTRGPEGRR